MKCPLVSVIVNCHNGQKYLAECIRSILNQTYTNFEIIFWDNFSIKSGTKTGPTLKRRRRQRRTT